METVFKKLFRSAHHANVQHQVSAKNIMHLNTPGYTPEEVAPLSFEKELHSAPIKKTHMSHLSGFHEDNPFQVKKVSSSASGNTVDLNGELHKGNEANLHQLRMIQTDRKLRQMATTVYQLFQKG